MNMFLWLEPEGSFCFQVVQDEPCLRVVLVLMAAADSEMSQASGEEM